MMNNEQGSKISEKWNMNNELGSLIDEKCTINNEQGSMMNEQSLVEKTSFAAVFWPFFAAVLAPSNSDSSKCPTLNAAVKNHSK